MSAPIIPLNDLRPSDDEEAALQAAVNSVIAQGRYVAGPQVEAFESEFAAYCGVAHCIGVASGTDALVLSLRALDLPPGSEVATIATAGGYTSIAIEQNGLVPCYVDCQDDGLMSASHLEQLMASHHLGAVVVTHLYGNASGAPDIVQACAKRGIPIVEDCAQAHGALVGNRRVGNLGSVGCFSFYPTKNLGALGDAGAVVTADADIANRLRQLRNYGWRSKRYVSDLAGGINSRLDELQAAVLRIRLRSLDQRNQRRRAIAGRYLDAVSDLTAALGRQPGPHDVFHLFVLRCQNRPMALKHFEAKSIATDIHYPVPDYRQPRFKRGRLEPTTLSNTEAHCRQILTIPCYPSMSDANVDRVCSALLQGWD
jgi:dTDP-4-amino-4,6-dideoxygalactose transaminase